MPVRHHNAKDLKEAGLTEAELQEIADDFGQKSTDYEQTAQYVTNVLLKTPGVHSVRYRVKNPLHLAKKILRKKLENKERVLTVDTYEKEITDLAGIRILHLFKNDWRSIHEYITSTWELFETPTAYHRQGDPDDFLKMFEGCEIKVHPKGYRSVHYIIETSPTKAKRYVELQVRTIFEEGWSEIDHTIRYPSFSDDPLTNNLLMILNRLAGSADEMSSFVQQLSLHLVDSKAKYAELERKRAELQKIIDKKSTSDEDKTTLRSWVSMLESIPNASEVLYDPVAGSADMLLSNVNWLSLIPHHGSGPQGPQGPQGPVGLRPGEDKALSKRMVAFIEQEVGEPKPGHVRLMAPLSDDESVRLYNAVLDKFPGALHSISGAAGRDMVTAAANSFLTKIGRVK